MVKILEVESNNQKDYTRVKKIGDFKTTQVKVFLLLYIKFRLKKNLKKKKISIKIVREYILYRKTNLLFTILLISRAAS